MGWVNRLVGRSMGWVNRLIRELTDHGIRPSGDRWVGLIGWSGELIRREKSVHQ